MGKGDDVTEKQLERSSSGNGMKITFKELEYLVPSNVEKGKKAALLKNVSGHFLPGQMAALMGPSGSGKTTLLDILAGRKTAGEINGTIRFAAHPPSQMFLRRYTGYVEQFDTLLDILTVYEMLMYTAELKRPVSEPIATKREEVNKLLDKLALDTARNTKIGNSLNRGISGGQAKRVNVAIALITQPRVLFLDEPTSGLDSYTANEVMTYVKKFTEDGVTICATIHSPSPYAFALFDRVMMLVRGQVVFFGDRARAQPYFEALAPDARLATENEAEWLTDVIVQADREKKGGELAKSYESSELKKENDADLEGFLKEKDEVSGDTLKELAIKRATVTPFYSALKTLIKYRTTRNYRNPEFLGPRIGDKVIFSLLIGTLYWGVGDDATESNIMNVAAVLFMWTTLPAFGAASYVPAIVLERALFIREKNDGLYRVITYLCAKMVDELVVAGFASAIFGIIVFMMVGLQGSFLTFWLAYFLTLTNGIVLAYCVAAFSPNMDVANAALPTYVVTLLFFAGFLFRFHDIPKYWFWYSKINLLRYAWGALMKNQFDSKDFENLTINGDDGRVDVLTFYSLNEVTEASYLGILLVFAAAFFFLAFLGMTFVKHSAR
ncbi:hypothetical protein BSKO_03644 [Bryopsis sp. KO-2023]|nr:hypothetical protein BSKO_03644 [Bryopsis sp. KO-2023]